MQYVILIFAALLRIVPHPFNVTPIGAIGIFAGTWCDRRIAWLIPLIPLALGDLVTGGYNPLIMVFVYTGFALSAVVGRFLLAEKRTLMRFGSAFTVNALIFYLLSNFPVWLVYYPNTWAGLIECYLKGLPYLGYSFLGDLFYGVIIFGAFELAQRWVNRRQAAAA